MNDQLTVNISADTAGGARLTLCSWQSEPSAPVFRKLAGGDSLSYPLLIAFSGRNPWPTGLGERRGHSGGWGPLRGWDRKSHSHSWQELTASHHFSWLRSFGSQPRALYCGFHPFATGAHLSGIWGCKDGKGKRKWTYGYLMSQLCPLDAVTTR